MGSAAVTHTEMASRKAQWIAGKDVSRPGSSAARHNNGIDLVASITGYLGANQRSIGRSAGRIIASGHIHFYVTESVFGKMRTQRRYRLIGFHVGDESQIHL